MGKMNELPRRLATPVMSCGVYSGDVADLSRCDSLARFQAAVARDGARFMDVTAKWKVGYGGWTWNAKFADLDNDTWQDLFLAQGTRLRLYNPSNVFYRNQGGKVFEEQTRAAGLEDHLPTASSL